MNIINYLFLIFLAIIFFFYGLCLSIFIDYLFPDIRNDYPEYLSFIEIILELLIVYIIYFIFQKYINEIIIFFMKENSILYLNNILLLFFSFGIYYHLHKSSKKINYFKNKYIINNIKNYKIYKFFNSLNKN
tara:strand:+ start:75 stop:470 length:396 start_codon:yes stop_codon:yes gene_type:complete